METLLIVNGEKYWADFFPEFKVVQKKVQNTSWVLKEGELFAVDEQSVEKPDGILWRVGAIKPGLQQINALNAIDLSGVPCLNSAQSLKIGYDRLSMLNALKKCGLPLIPFNVATKSTFIKNIGLDFPFVVKAGNFHGGYGKVLVKDARQWQDIQDLLFISNDYITVEPFIDYKYDLRYLAIGERVWAMSRKGKFWKANVATKAFKQIPPQATPVAQVKKIQQHVGADILAIDILETADGTQHIVEYNDIPGLSGFPDALKFELASLLKTKLFKTQPQQ